MSKKVIVITFAILTIFSILMILGCSKKANNADNGVPSIGPGAFSATQEIIIEEGANTSFELLNYSIIIHYLKSDPHTMLLKVNDKELTVTLANKNETCEPACRYGGICLDDYVVFGVQPEPRSNNWNTTRLRVTAAITMSPCGQGIQLA
jgi:hypothetical protein